MVEVVVVLVVAVAVDIYVVNIGDIGGGVVVEDDDEEPRTMIIVLPDVKERMSRTAGSCFG